MTTTNAAEHTSTVVTVVSRQGADIHACASEALSVCLTLGASVVWDHHGRCVPIGINDTAESVIAAYHSLPNNQR